jgi:hypothetical protein
MRRNTVLALAAALVSAIAGFSTAGSANAGSNGQQVEVDVPPGYLIPSYQVPKNMRVFAKGTNNYNAPACTELENVGESPIVVYGKPSWNQWWWKYGIQFTIVGTISDFPGGVDHEVAYRAEANIDEQYHTDVVKFESVTTPWSSVSARDPQLPRLSFRQIAWEPGTQVCS